MRVRQSLIALPRRLTINRPRRQEPSDGGGGGTLPSLPKLLDFCGSHRTRDGETARELTGTTGTGAAIELDQLDPERPPGDVPPRRWCQFIADVSAFRASGFAEQATALGWTDADLFGCDDKRPYARIDCMGLIWLLNGNRLLALSADTAVIEMMDGARLTFRKSGRQRPA